MSKETAARIAVRDTLIQLVEQNRQFSQAVQADHQGGGSLAITGHGADGIAAVVDRRVDTADLAGTETVIGDL